MNTSPHFPLIYVSGGPRERGRSYGKQCASAIARTVRYYRTRINLPRERQDGLANEYLAAIEAAAPELHEEILGICEGSGASAADIGLLHARSEIISGNECTSVSFPSSRVMGQTWDWSMRLEGLAMLLHVTKPDGLRMLMLVEPGMVGKIGLNSAGVGVCLNFLKSPEPLAVGVPFHVLSRLALDARSTEAATAVAKSQSGACAGHLLVGDADGHAASIELSGLTQSVVTSSMYELCHTNHYLRRKGASRGMMKDIETRRRYAGLLFQMEDCAPCEESLQLVLQDGRGLFPICRPRGLPFVKDPSVTIAIVTMDLRRRRLSIRRGASAGLPFATHIV